MPTSTVVLERSQFDVRDHALRDGQGTRPLDGDHGRRQRLVAQLDVQIGRSVGCEPVEDLQAVAGVDNQPEK